MKTYIAALLISAAPCLVLAEATKPGTYYVSEPTVEERLSPDSKGAVTNRLHKNQKVEVFEIRKGWARVSQPYDGRVEGKRGQVARWVRADGLSSSKAADSPQPALPDDPRISKDAFPKAGEGGLTEQDVSILYKGAVKFLNEGKCTRVEYGDKSTGKPGTYFINVGGKNLFFTAADVQ